MNPRRRRHNRIARKERRRAHWQAYPPVMAIYTEKGAALFEQLMTGFANWYEAQVAKVLKEAGQ